MHLFKKQGQQRSGRQSKDDPQKDRNRDIYKADSRNSLSLHHAGKCRKQDDHIDVIHRCACKDHLGNPFLFPISLLHQPDHPRYDHCRRDCGKNGSQDGCLQDRQPHEPGPQKDHSQHLKACRNKAHEKRRPACLF